MAYGRFQNRKRAARQKVCNRDVEILGDRGVDAFVT